MSSESLHDEAAGRGVGDQCPREGVCVAQDMNGESAGRYVLDVEPGVTPPIHLDAWVM